MPCGGQKRLDDHAVSCDTPGSLEQWLHTSHVAHERSAVAPEAGE